MNIYVGNLDFNLDKEELEKIFGEYGEVNSAKIITDKFSGRSKGFGFVEMVNEDEAQKAINELSGATVENRHVLRRAKGKKNISSNTNEEIALEFENLSVFIDKGTAPKEDIIELLLKINRLYKLHGGNGIIYSEEDINVFELSNSL